MKFWIIICIVLAAFAYAVNDKSLPTPAEQPHAQKPTPQKHGNGEGPPPAASEPTDAGSIYAKNLLKQMNEVEYVSYLKAFVAVLEKGEADRTYQWTTQSAAGKIVAGAPFVTATKQYCRGFSESYAVANESQYLTGVACRNGKGGWCKLRPGSTYNCIHTHPGGVAGVMLDTNIAIDRLNNSATQMGNRFNSFKANLPF